MAAPTFGKYEILRRIAVGGMAGIYLAVQRGSHGFEKVVVLKVILPELSTNDEFISMFLDEARLAATLEHTNVVRVYDFGSIDGRYYLCMEHLPGEDLSSVLQRLKSIQRPVPQATAFDVVIGAAIGLDYVHRLSDSMGRPLNIVHRDVSPSNIIVTYHGQVKLVDFGIARATSNINQTAVGTLKGKVAYVSPEQAAGDVIDGRSDIFALGTVLYELLTGVRLFKRESDLATLRAVVSESIAPPSTLRPDLPPEADRIVLKALSRPLEQRYQSGAEMADDLMRLMTTQGWLRSERALADFMTQTFDATRRAAKLSVSPVAENETTGVLRTPSIKSKELQNFLPLRSHEELPVVPGSLLPGEEDELALSEPPPRSTQRRGLLIGGAVTLLVGGAGLTYVLKSSQGPPLNSSASPIVAPGATRPPTATAATEEDAGETASLTGTLPPTNAETPDASSIVQNDVPPQPPSTAPTSTPKALARGKLTLDTVPWSSVYLNGRKLGDTPLVDYALRPGFHELKLVNEAKGISQVVELEVVAGKTTTKKLRLSSNAR
jgi:eukaryotic-like serine/threonine-protein kinase